MKNLIKICLISLFAVVLFNCGGEEKKDEKESVKIGTKKAEKKEDDSVAKLVITGDDNMQFSTKELRVKAGQSVKLTLRHIGKMDVNIMGHNVVILKKGTDTAAFAAKAATERDNGYIPVDSDEVIAHTNMIGGGQVATVEFTAPEAGEYDFICSFPAHFALMQGKLIVE